ncbi:DUF7288 family protein [Haloprofundus halobius]|uniref:DUF7288 family protein n=1 Tax=Haloprofundus halobius TaxID=2876194 RepID=UPI001CCD5D7B|nr:hypothetical protein [Haloprofundus halobius]
MSPGTSRGRGTDRGRGDRGQAHTLEAVLSAMILLTSVIFALQVTAVTPLSASTSSQHIENQQQATAEGVLATTVDSGSLERTLLFWGDDDGDGDDEFRGATDEAYYTGDYPPTEFGRTLRSTFGDRGVAANVYVRHHTDAGDERTQRLFYQGEPSDNAATATQLVTLYDDAVLYDDEDDDGVAEPTETEIDGSNFYAENADGGDSGVYNVLRVEVVVWRM